MKSGVCALYHSLNFVYKRTNLNDRSRYSDYVTCCMKNIMFDYVYVMFDPIVLLRLRISGALPPLPTRLHGAMLNKTHGEIYIRLLTSKERKISLERTT